MQSEKQSRKPAGKKLRSYLDNCAYNRPYDDQSQIKIELETQAKLEIQRQIRDGEVELSASYILVAENTANKFDAKRNDIQSFIDDNTYVYVSDKSKDVRRTA